MDDKNGLGSRNEGVAEPGQPSELWRAVVDGDLDPKEVHPRRLPGCNHADESHKRIDVC